MPRIKVPQLSSTPPPPPAPRVGTTCAYLSWSALVIKLSRLPGKPGGGPFTRDIVGVSVATQVTL
jgi:hypothetical protein